jgi:hypothetical protein
MLATTTDVTTDIVSMPLLWVIPLALYLLTFIIVFSKSIPARLHLYVTLMTPVLVLLVVFLRASQNVPQTELKISFKLQLALSLVTFFFVALTCHGELARTRPDARHLTEFYLIMSVGGVVGGLFNALVAPLAFTFVTEYPVSLVAACFLLPPLGRLLNPDAPQEPRPWTIWDFILPLLFFAAARFLSAYFMDVARACASVLDGAGVRLRVGARALDDARIAATILAFGLPTLACYFLVERPLRFGACVAALWIGAFFTFTIADRKVAEEDRTTYTRSYFGTIKVTMDYNRDPEDGAKLSPFRQLVHGTTVHGSQLRDRVEYETSVTQALWLAGATGPADALGLAYIAQPHFEFPGREPLSYYTRSGPVGIMFDVIRAREAGGRPADVACIGLGTGTLSSYGRPGQKMTFFEIDWTVRNLVEKDKYFTYITRAKAQKTDIEFLMGDARLSLEQTDRKWGFMLVDAFSSDSIPAHLLTREAVELYFNRLTDYGLLALHISNRYLKLEPVVERIVKELQCDALVMHDYTLDSSNYTQPEFSGKLSSTWVVVGRTPAALAPFRALAALAPFRSAGGWVPLEGNPRVGLWTDDYTPLKSVLQGEWNLFGE